MNNTTSVRNMAHGEEKETIFLFKLLQPFLCLPENSSKQQLSKDNLKRQLQQGMST